MSDSAGPSPADPAPFWDQRFAETGFAYGDQPNDFLREQAAQLPVGRALCLAEGEGRNAVHRAPLGHAVIARVISPEGLAEARQLAASRDAAIPTLCCDLARKTPPQATVDLVVATWMHRLPPLSSRRACARSWRARAAGVAETRALGRNPDGAGRGAVHPFALDRRGWRQSATDRRQNSSGDTKPLRRNRFSRATSGLTPPPGFRRCPPFC